MPATRIPGLPDAPEPSFRTRDRRWMGLDSLVWETIATLEEQGRTLSPVVVKATVQVARMAVQVNEELSGDALVEQVRMSLRARRVILPADVVRAILVAYVLVVGELDILEVSEVLP